MSWDKSIFLTVGLYKGASMKKGIKRTKPPIRVVWKDVPGEGCPLKISNRGDVVRVDRRYNKYREVPLKAHNRNRSVYVLSKIKGKVKQFSVATLLAKAFYDPDATSSNLVFIDGDKTNITTTNTKYVDSSTGSSFRQKPGGHRNIRYIKRSKAWEVRFCRRGKHYRSGLLYDLDQAIKIRDEWMEEVDSRIAKEDRANKILRRKYG